MNDITHSDYCPIDNTGDLEDCEHCMAELRRTQAFYRELFSGQPHYSRAELEDVYSDPTDYAKRERMLAV